MIESPPLWLVLVGPVADAIKASKLAEAKELHSHCAAVAISQMEKIIDREGTASAISEIADHLD